MHFEFSTSGRIIFGKDSLSQAPELASQNGRHTLLVTGRNQQRAESIYEALIAKGLAVSSFAIDKEPTTELIEQGRARAEQAGCDHVLGIGGGSVIDGAKAIAALMTNTGDLFDYLEIIGAGKHLMRPAAPCIAIPTTAGTGAEATRNSVLESTQHRVKVSLRSELMLPRYALVDPALTYDLPAHITAASGLDALTQLLEAFVSPKATPMTDALCREGLHRARSLLTAWKSANEQARIDMSLAALFSGIVLANAKLGAVHGLAGPLGGMFAAPHGEICARLLPLVMEVNIRALKRRQPEHGALKRYQEGLQILSSDKDMDVWQGLNWIHELCNKMNMRPLSVHGIKNVDFQEIIPKAKNASSMQGNPIELTEEELQEILSRAL